MKKLIFIILISVISLNAQVFTKGNILGVWKVSSIKPQGFTSFGKEFSKNRSETYTLLFNRQGFVKNKTTNTIYNYDIINNQLRIYQTKTYRNNYQIKNKKRFDLWQISDTFENCYKAEIKTKKLGGYYNKQGYKWCKIQGLPKPIIYLKEDFNF